MKTLNLRIIGMEAREETQFIVPELIVIKIMAEKIPNKLKERPILAYNAYKTDNILIQNRSFTLHTIIKTQNLQKEYYKL